MSDLKGWRFANRDLVDDAMDEKEEAEGLILIQEVNELEKKTETILENKENDSSIFKKLTEERKKQIENILLQDSYNHTGKCSGSPRPDLQSWMESILNEITTWNREECEHLIEFWPKGFVEISSSGNRSSWQNDKWFPTLNALDKIELQLKNRIKEI
jgi:hypothetical protein